MSAEGLALLREPLREDEQWRPVVGFEGLYSVSNLGRVKSEPRFRAGKSCSLVPVAGRILALPKTKDGYLSARLCTGVAKRHRYARVHVLVLEAYLGPRPLGHDACHNNGDPSDNRLSNLRWDTKQSNAADRLLHGTDCKGAKNGSAKLTEMDASSILGDKRPCSHIAKEYGVSRSTISMLKRRTTWKHLGATA